MKNNEFKIIRKQYGYGEFMTRAEYNTYRGWELPSNENGSDEGVKITNNDHTSWIPMNVYQEECLLKDSELPWNGKKTLGNTCADKTTKNVSDVIFWGNGDTFKLVSKASSQKEGWMKSTKCLETNEGCIVQVTTQQRNPDGSYSVAEALTFVPNATLLEVRDDNGIVTSRKIG